MGALTLAATATTARKVPHAKDIPRGLGADRNDSAVSHLTTFGEMRRTEVRVNLPGQTAAAMKASGTAGGSTGPWLLLFRECTLGARRRYTYVGVEPCYMMLTKSFASFEFCKLLFLAACAWHLFERSRSGMFTDTQGVSRHGVWEDGQRVCWDDAKGPTAV